VQDQKRGGPYRGKDDYRPDSEGEKGNPIAFSSSRYVSGSRKEHDEPQDEDRDRAFGGQFKKAPADDGPDHDERDESEPVTQRSGAC
jgi:hypothetical protein